MAVPLIPSHADGGKSRSDGAPILPSDCEKYCTHEPLWFLLRKGGAAGRRSLFTWETDMASGERYGGCKVAVDRQSLFSSWVPDIEVC